MADPKLTVVMLNWQRPENVRRFTHFYATHHRVAQIIIGDNNPYAGVRQHATNITNGLDEESAAKVVVASFTQDVGLPSRFALGALARTDQVLLVDDDINLPDNTIIRLHNEFLKHDAGAVGLFGRNTEPNGKYTTRTDYDEVEIVLTRAVITTPQICAEAAWRSVQMAKALGGEPFGNGEDIVMSYVATKKTLRANLAFNLPYKNVGYDDQNAISVRFPKHLEHRSKVVRWCRENI